MADAHPGHYWHSDHLAERRISYWEALVDRVLPPVVDANGCRFDEDYWERILYHVFHIGGPEAAWNPDYQPRRLWALLDRWDALVLRVRERRDTWKMRWATSWAKWDDWWLDRKDEWRLKLSKTWLGSLCVAPPDVEEGLEQPFLYDPHQVQYGTFSPSSPTDEQTPSLLQHAALYTAMSVECYNQDPDSGEEPGVPIIVPKTSSPPRSIPSGSPPSALSGKKRFFRILPAPWKPKRSVRFNGVHDFLVYDKLPGEPTGCYKPDYSHLIGPQADPQLDVIITVLHAVSSSSRQAPTRIPPRPYQFHASQEVVCNA